jgi:putative endopeptidase
MSMQPGLDLAALDKQIRPQDDLFRHVNGSWMRETEIPSDKAVYGSFHMLNDDAELAVREIIEQAAASPEPGVSQQIGDLYASFMNEQLAEELGAKPIAEELAAIRAVSDLDGLTELLGKLQRAGTSGLFGSYVDNDPGDPSRYLVHLYQGGLGLPDEAYYRDAKYEEIRGQYVAHIARMFELASGQSAADAAVTAQAIMSFETELAKLHWSVVESRDAEKTYNLRAFSELQQQTATFDFERWLAGAGVKPGLLETNVTMMPSFFEGLAAVYSSATLATLKLWLEWQLIRSRAPYLSAEIVAERFDFYGSKLTGQPENRPRWKRGVGLVEGGLGEAIGQIYVAKHFKPEAKSSMDALVAHLIEAYRQSISSLEWMTDATRGRALEKLSKFTPKIGYPSRWKDYSSIVIDRDDLVGNVRRISAWEFQREADKIGKPIDREEWFMTPQTVNAYYNPGFNEIVFPAAILQPPFFSTEADAAVNFGAIGAVIGHEIGHGFDDQGSKYDGDGKLESWWTAADREAFEKRTGSLIAQYAALTPQQLADKTEDYRVNGELTIGENIGDLGGLSIAWKAYLISLDGAEPPVIDGLTAAQRFLISWAQAWRTISRDEIAIQRLATDPHSPPEFRCNQVVRNLDVFYEAFGVTAEDELWLDAADRVSIW